MNKLLIQNNMSPTIFRDPNSIDMLSISEVVALMRSGQAYFAEQ
jgi:hypothetical protein